MSNLFSSFDPWVFYDISYLDDFSPKTYWGETLVTSACSPFGWISARLFLVFIPQAFWLAKSQRILFFEKLRVIIRLEIKAIYPKLIWPGTEHLWLSLFFFILFSNGLGLVPYIFTSTRHLVLTISLALPIWLGRILYSIRDQYNRIFAHLVPAGTPWGLIPAMVVIETVRRLIRPWTLSIRLAANIIAGHLLLTLLGNMGPNVRLGIFRGYITVIVLLVRLEVAVACIQAYVFTILSALYLQEVRVSINHHKNFKDLKFRPWSL